MKRRIEELLLAPDTTVTCPECEHEFSLEEGFAKKALERLEDASATAIAALRKKERSEVEKRAKELATERETAARQEAADLRKLLQEQGEAHSKAVAQVKEVASRSFLPQIDALRAELAERDGKLKTLGEREAALEISEREIDARVNDAAKAKAMELFASERLGFEQRLAERETQVATLRDEQVQLRDEREKLRDEKAALSLEVRKQVDALVQQRESTVRAQETERSKLREADLQKKLDDLSQQLADAQRKAEQGSQQLQGEVLELAIEEALRRNFPIDAIEEVKKGARGGDVIQRITTMSGQCAGVILWETKRAKDWSAQWVTKLKTDMREAGADICVLVTMPTAMPKEWEVGQQFGLHDGLWVTSWTVAASLAEVLRAGLIDVHKQRLVSAGKGEKMEAVYDYVTSPQFAQKLRAVYDAFQKMREELESEKSQSMQRWARREKQLQAGVASLLGIGGEIQGLAQQGMPQLELEDRGADDGN